MNKTKATISMVAGLLLSIMAAKSLQVEDIASSIREDQIIHSHPERKLDSWPVFRSLRNISTLEAAFRVEDKVPLQGINNMDSNNNHCWSPAGKEMAPESEPMEGLSELENVREFAVIDARGLLVDL